MTNYSTYSPSASNNLGNINDSQIIIAGSSFTKHDPPMFTSASHVPYDSATLARWIAKSRGDPSYAKNGQQERWMTDYEARRTEQLLPKLSRAAQVALGYAGLGYSIFPVSPDKKSPLTKDWQQKATTDFKTIREWWKKWPRAMIGLPCRKNGVLAVDLDEKDGKSGLAKWAGYGIDDSRALMTLTPTGGQHRLFGYNYKNGDIGNSPLEEGIDVRGRGGFVILPGSVKSDGGGYVALSDWSLKPPELPAKLKEILLSKQSGNYDSGSEPYTGEAQPERANLLLDYFVTEASESDRNWAGFRLASELHAIGLTKEEARPVMQEYRKRVNLEVKKDHPYRTDEMLASLDSAYNRARREPMYLPGVDDYENGIGDFFVGDGEIDIQAMLLPTTGAVVLPAVTPKQIRKADAATYIGKENEKWFSPKAVEPSTVPVVDHGESVTLDQVRPYLDKLIYDIYMKQQAGIHVVNVTMGAGKTYAGWRAIQDVAESLSEIGNSRFAVAVGTLKDQAGNYPGAYPIQPRRGANTDAEGNEIDSATCKYPKQTERLAQKGYNVTESLCRRCPWGMGDLMNCPWHAQFKQREHFFMHYKQAVTSRKWFDNGEFAHDLVLIDEVQAADFSTLHKWSMTQVSSMRDKHPKLAPIVDLLVSLLNELDGSTPIADSALHARVAKYFPNGIPKIKVPEPKLKIKDNLDEQIEDLIDNNFVDAINQLRLELEQYLSGVQITSALYATEKSLMYRAGVELPEGFDSVPLVVLCGTPFVEGWETLGKKHGIPVEVHKINVPHHPSTAVVSDISRNNSKASVLDTKSPRSEKYRNRFIENLSNNLKNLDKPLFIMTKRIEEEIVVPLLESEIYTNGAAVVHYGNLAGLNSFQEHENVVCSQLYVPSLDGCADVYRALYGGSEGESLDTESMVYIYEPIINKRRDQAWLVARRVPQDKRLREIFIHLQNSEMLQGIYRVRPANYPRNIFIECAVTLDGLVPDEIVYKNHRTNKAKEILDATKIVLERDGSATTEAIAAQGSCSKMSVWRYKKTIIDTLGLKVERVIVKSEAVSGWTAIERFVYA